MDLALALVKEDLGHEVAMEIAQLLVMFLKRPGGQPQISSTLAVQAAASGPLLGIVDWIVAHLGEDLRIEVLAARASMSSRNFARTFLRQIGLTPAKFVEAARLERACSCLTFGSGSLKEIAAACGFGSDEQMRRAFLRVFRVPPEHYREAQCLPNRLIRTGSNEAGGTAFRVRTA